MPQVAELVQRIYDGLNHNPDLAQYKASVIRRFNDAYEEVNDSADWHFLQRVVEVQIRATRTGSAANTVTYSSANRRRITASGGTAFFPDMEGQTYVHPEGGEFVIGRVDLTAPGFLFLTTPIPTIGLTTSAGWSIRFDRYAVPEDCAEVLGIVSRRDDLGRIAFLDRRTEEKDYLDRDSTGDPTISVEDDWLNSRAPPRAPILANNAGVGNLRASTEYEYVYCFLYEGRESPPSPAASIITGAGANRAVDISGLEDTSWNDLGVPLEARRDKVIYRRDVTATEPWERVAIITVGTTITFTDSVLLPVGTDVNPTGDREGLREFREAGPREHLRLWFTPDLDKLVSFRYRRRPRRLQADSDVPEWPTPYHRVLVDLVLADVLDSHGLTAEAERKLGRAQVKLRRMVARYTTKTDREWRFRRFDRDVARRTNYGRPSIAP